MTADVWFQKRYTRAVMQDITISHKFLIILTCVCKLQLSCTKFETYRFHTSTNRIPLYINSPEDGLLKPKPVRNSMLEFNTI